MKRALVVDDEPLLRRQVAEIVSGYGFDEILEAENGVQAVEIATHQDVLLVVMDVGMPVMDGITAAEKIGKIKALPIVLVTASTASETIEREVGAIAATRLCGRLRVATAMGGRT